MPTNIAKANLRLSLLLEAKTVSDYILLHCLVANGQQQQKEIICLLGYYQQIMVRDSLDWQCTNSAKQ